MTVQASQFYILLYVDAHWVCFTHLLCTSSSTVPLGHWQPTTHCSVQITGPGFLQVGGHAVPHVVNTCPLIGHFFMSTNERQFSNNGDLCNTKNTII